MVFHHRPDFVNRTKDEAMTNIQIASAPIGTEVQIILHTFHVVSTNYNHRLIRLVVFRFRFGVSHDELETASKTPLELKSQSVVTRIRCALEQTDPRKAGDWSR